MWCCREFSSIRVLRVFLIFNYPSFYCLKIRRLVLFWVCVYRSCCCWSRWFCYDYRCYLPLATDGRRETGLSILLNFSFVHQTTEWWQAQKSDDWLLKSLEKYPAHQPYTRSIPKVVIAFKRFPVYLFIFLELIRNILTHFLYSFIIFVSGTQDWLKVSY